MLLFITVRKKLRDNNLLTRKIN